MKWFMKRCRKEGCRVIGGVVKRRGPLKILHTCIVRTSLKYLFNYNFHIYLKSF